MSAEHQDQDFEKLQQMLKLKRYESPPPRYFNEFSGKVTARLRSGEGTRKMENFEDVVSQTPWLHRIWQTIEGKPALSGLFAAAVCGILITGIFIVDNTAPTMPTLATNQPETPSENLEILGGEGSLFAVTPQAGNSLSPTAVMPGSTPSLFNNVLALPTAPVSFKPHSLTNGLK